MLFEKSIEKMYRANLFARQDNPNGIFYFSPADFPGLQAHSYTFPARAGHTKNDPRLEAQRRERGRSPWPSLSRRGARLLRGFLWDRFGAFLVRER